MKGLGIQTMLGVMAILVVATFSILSLAGFSWDFSASIQTDGGCTLVRPEFGRVECEPVSNSKTTLGQISFAAADYGENPYYRVECGDNENSPACDFAGICNTNVAGGAEFFFQTSDPDYNCAIGGSTWCHPVIQGNTLTTLTEDSPIGTTFQVGACRKLGIAYYPGSVSTKFVPYGLNVYEFGGAFRYNTQSCSLSDWGFADRGNVIVDCGNLPGCTNEYSGDFLAYDDWVNYLAGWSYVVEGLDSRYVADYNGQDAYCIAGTIYSLKDVDTLNGACYSVQSSVIGNEDCCPGMVVGNQVCGNDFQYHNQGSGEIECYTDLNCFVPIATGTEYVPDYGTSDLDVVKWQCISNKCEVVDRKAVQCVPPNVGCPDGQVCNPNKGFICENQIGPGIECGDGICSPPYESAVTCPQDCSNPTLWTWDFLWIIGLALIGAGIGFAVGKWKGLMAGAGIGTVIGLVIYWFVGLSWWQQILLGIGGVAGTGFIIYLFGGAILSFIAIAIYAWRKK